MNSVGKNLPTRILSRFIWSIAAAWTIVVGALVGVSIYSNRLQAEETALAQARSNFQRDVIYRQWSAKYGPLYARIDKGIAPNPYLADIPGRDITTTTGVKLTQVNPAYMNRLVFDLAAKEHGVKGHITSLRPVRPENSPDAWEVLALTAFEAGKSEISSLETMDGRLFLRMMRPLVVEKDCLACHQKHGDHEGDVRGGISVGVPMEPLYLIANKDILVSSLSFMLLWLIGLGGIAAGTRRIRRAMDERDRAEQEIFVLNQSLIERGDALETANRELESFNYTVSHDLRSPLSTIGGFCALIQDLPADKHPEKCSRYTGIILNETTRMEKLVTALLEFSRLSHAEPRRLPADLSRTAREIVEELQRTDPARSPLFKIEENVTVMGDPTLLRVVMQNLLGNAWKYTGKQKQTVIEFGAMMQGQERVFFVRDNGAGFEKEKAARIFDAFQRLHKDAEFKGTGIGLATVKRIITRHNGRVWAEGEPGKGATIFFTLPFPVLDGTQRV